MRRFLMIAGLVSGLAACNVVTGADDVEFGPINATIHKVNEEVLIDDLPRMRDVYSSVLHKLMA